VSVTPEWVEQFRSEGYAAVGPVLTPEELEIIKQWIEAGAPE